MPQHNADNVRQAVTGSVYWDPTRAAAAPTGTSTALDTAYADLGFIHTDGVSLIMPEAGEATPLRAWQNNAVVRIVRTPPDTPPQLTCTLIETKLEVIEMAFGVEVTQTATEGSFVINTNAPYEYGNLVFDVIDGSELIRAYAPKAIVTGLSEIVFSNSGDAIGYAVTIDCEYDQDLGGQVKTWMTALAEVTP